MWSAPKSMSTSPFWKKSEYKMVCLPPRRRASHPCSRLQASRLKNNWLLSGRVTTATIQTGLPILCAGACLSRPYTLLSTTLAAAAARCFLDELYSKRNVAQKFADEFYDGDVPYMLENFDNLSDLEIEQFMHGYQVTPGP